jgi:hypothetical protein
MKRIAELMVDGSRAHLAPYLPEIPNRVGGSIARLHFDSLAELAEFIPETAPADAFSKWGWGGNDPSFYGSAKTMADALKLAREGWQEGAEQALPLLERVKVARPTRKTLTRYAIAGAVASVPRYLANNPLHMRSVQRSDTAQRPVITIVSSTAAPCYVDEKTFRALAVAAVAIVDRLEDAGFRTEVIAGRRESNSSTGTADATGENNAAGNRSEVFFRLKAADDSLDMARVVFGIGHPAVHRRLLFGACEMHPGYEPSIGTNQGYAVGLTNLDRPPGTYILPAMASLAKNKLSDPIKVFDYAVEVLKKQGCPGLTDE